MSPTYKMDWILGEDKYVDLEVRSRPAGPVVVPRAVWNLKRNIEGTIEQTGTCEVDGGRIGVLVEPQQVGAYTLEITYEIPPETRKVRVMLDVR
ncbi:hypothetical protein [Anaeromassilibacillus senegalensis]|uniref:hypothetical protein n=1 Tax=Anaeromassilibacillus senegalensis TaxID=1673717 RepID=UPI0012B65C29|nr:hypothetical protein [Anaeromassilibacillus senegalensis]